MNPRTGSVHPRILGLLGCLALFALGALSPAQDSPKLPPGVRLEPAPAPDDLPPGYRAEAFTVDWTQPLLRVRVVNGLSPGRTTSLDWSAAQRQRPDALRIQLSEPVEEGGAWRLALPLAGPPAPGSATAAARSGAARLPHFAITGLCPWLAGGPPVAREPELASPLADSGALAAVRWLGRLEDLADLTSMTFRARCLVSWTRPESGSSRFALLLSESGGEITADTLRPWLAGATAPGEWVAIHSQGRYATVGTGTGNWRLGGPPDPRRAERLGGALELEALRAGELVDWARLPGAAVRVPSFETGYEASHLIRGLLWPAPFSPRIWISRPLRPEDGVPFAEVDLGDWRPVERIVIAWPAAAGWSAQFQPRRATLKATLERRTDFETLKTIEAPLGPFFECRLREAASLRQLRVELEEPSGMPLDGRARLAAIQLWGPWDGRTGK